MGHRISQFRSYFQKKKTMYMFRRWSFSLNFWKISIRCKGMAKIQIYRLVSPPMYICLYILTNSSSHLKVNFFFMNAFNESVILLEGKRQLKCIIYWHIFPLKYTIIMSKNAVDVVNFIKWFACAQLVSVFSGFYSTVRDQTHVPCEVRRFFFTIV